MKMNLNMLGHWTGVIILILYLVVVNYYPLITGDMMNHLSMRLLGLILLVLLMEYPLIPGSMGKVLGILFALAITYTIFLTTSNIEGYGEKGSKLKSEEKSAKEQVQAGPGKYALDTMAHPSQHQAKARMTESFKSDLEAPKATGGAADHALEYTRQLKQDRPHHKAMSDNAFEGVDNQIKGMSADHPEPASSGRLFQAEKGL